MNAHGQQVHPSVTMFAGIALFLALAGNQQPWPDRADFGHRMAKIERGWTMAQVRDLLGNPDNVWPPNNARKYVQFGETAWCYGTDGHHTLPTLGYVVFREGKVLDVVGEASDTTRKTIGGTIFEVPGNGEPPSTSLIDERQLRDCLRKIGADPPPEPEFNPGRIVQVSNMLIGLGRERALAVLKEYARIQPRDGCSSWLYWVPLVAFRSTAKDGVFPVPYIGTDSLPEVDAAKWPTFPVALVDNVPFVFFSVGGFGPPEHLAQFIARGERDWQIRSAPIVPPDDPFPEVTKLNHSPYLSLAKWDQIDPALGMTVGEISAMKQVMQLVRSAIRPREAQAYFTRAEFEKYHQEFLALHCHWDRSKQVYVRGDGSTLADDVRTWPQQGYRFTDLATLDAN